MAFARFFSSVDNPDTHALDPQQESLMSSRNDSHEHTATEADNKEAASELNEYKHICYIAKIDQPNHIDSIESFFWGTIKKYKYQLWIKQLEQNRQGFIYYELNVKKDQIKQLHKRLQTNNNDRLNVLKNDIMNGTKDGDIYENIRKYLQKIFDMYILLTKWWLYDTLGISKQLRFKMEKYIDHIVKIIYDTTTRIKSDNDAENKFKDEIDPTNEDKYSFHTLYVVQRPIYQKKVIKLVNHWALKLIGENKLMTIDFNTTSDADVGSEYSGYISIDHCTLNSQNDDSRYDILRKRAFFLSKDTKSKKYYSFKIICKIDLKSNNYKNLICSESIGYLLERWYKYKKGIYNTVTNNCQHFVVEMLSIIDENKAQIIAKKMSVATAKGFMPYAVCVQHLFYNQEIKKSIAVLSKAMQQFHNTKKDRIQKRKIIHIIEAKYPQLSNNNSDYDSEHDSLESKVSELPNTRRVIGDDDDMDDDTKMSNNSQVKPPILIDDSKKSEQIGTDHSIAINNEPSIDIIPIETEIAKWLREITAQEDTDFYGLYFKIFNDAGLAKKKNLKYIFDKTISFDKICPKIPIIHEQILKDEISKIFVKNDDNIESKSNVNDSIINNDNE